MARAGGNHEDIPADPRLWRGVVTTMEARPALWLPLAVEVVLVVGWFWLLGFPGPGTPGFLMFAVVVVSALPLIVVRLTGWHPWVVVSDEGVAVGGWYSSALRRRNAARWSDVVFVSPIRHGNGWAQPRDAADRPSVREAPITVFKLWFARHTAPREFSIARRSRRPLVVRGPLAGIKVEQVHAEVVARWQRFGDPEVSCGDADPRTRRR